MVGQRLLHYEILVKLGEGGMGVVYKARDTHLDRFVAIKVLPAEKVADPERKRRFMQEAKAASALNHPNIITIHDISSDGGIDFIVSRRGGALDLPLGLELHTKGNLPRLRRAASRPDGQIPFLGEGQSRLGVIAVELHGCVAAGPSEQTVRCHRQFPSWIAALLHNDSAGAIQ
jgi:hypothetical protein